MAEKVKQFPQELDIVHVSSAKLVPTNATTGPVPKSEEVKMGSHLGVKTPTLDGKFF